MPSKEVSRREFLRVAGLASAAVGAGLPLASRAESVGKPPNVILIVSDDQGTVDMGCYGATDLMTPNMDQLASRGVRFTQFYVGAPICSPSRAALMTGRYPQHAGLANNAYGNHGLPTDQVTLADVMRSAGYRTAIFGKWHLGETLPLSPNARGFDEFLGFKVGCIDNYSHFFYWHGPNRHDLWLNEEEHWEPGVYFPDIVVREATRFLEENRDRPFFLYLPFNLPHYPLQPERRFVELYNGIQDPRRKRYAAFLTTLDDKVGTILKKVDDLGLTQDTLVIYFSDHGHSTEERAFGGGGSAGPYRGHKFTVWEGGIRVPAIVSWPGHLPEGQVRDQLVASMDLMPTIADLCGAKLPEVQLDGRSLRRVLESASAPSPHPVMHWAVGKRWAVRRGKWKLVFDQELFLADLEADPSESVNLANKFPDVVQELKREHERWLAEATR